jgi:hypothetical protein
VQHAREEEESFVVAPERCAEPLLLSLLLVLCRVLCVQDDFYLRHLIKNNLLDPVMDAFFSNGDRYNLLNSAVLEMVEFIRKENLKVNDGNAELSALKVEACWCGSGLGTSITLVGLVWQESRAGRSW